MAVDMKQAYRRIIEEAFGKGELGAFDEVCDPRSRFHDPMAGEMDLAGAKANCRMYRDAFPDMRPTILGSYADGNTVITHWRMSGTHRGALMQLQPTGKTGTVEGITVAKFRNGRLVEDWVQWDALGLMRQLGVAGSLVTAPAAAHGEEARPH
jgi:predicted ester cyclase